MPIDFRDLRVLVCTANLGNARPDEASIAALIPDNGGFTEVVNDTKYPLPTPDEQRALMEEIGFSKARSTVTTPVAHAAMVDMSNNSVSGNKASNNIPNMRGQPQLNMSTEEGDNYFDIIVVGLQEATFDVPPDDPIVHIPVVEPIFRKTFGRAVRKGQGTLDSISKSRDYTKDKGGLPDWLTARDSKVIGDLLSSRCPSYNFAVRFQRGEMRLEILTHRDLEVETLSVKAQNTGIGVNGIMHASNKGGIVAELLVDSSTRLTFCTTHLQAHEGKEKYLDRCRMTSAILDGTTPTDAPLAVDLALRSHVTFFLGDLNFRTELPDSANLTKEQHIEKVMKLVKKKKWRQLNLADELFKALRDKDCLVSFKTLPCFFPPTFKLERNGGLDYKDQRRPSYTDRILWRTLHKMEDAVKPLAYEPITAFSTSDHKPVRGAFLVQLNERIEPRQPLSKRRLTMSVKDLFSVATHQMGGIHGSKLHLFFNKIQCQFKKRAMAPEPYVVFMSFPTALVQQKVKRFQRFKNRFRQKMADELAGAVVSQPKLDSYGFPRTKRLNATYNPEWLKETHVTIATHCKEGKPFDLTGAILFLVVMDRAPTIAKSLLGIFPLNLAHLCMSTSASASRRSPEAKTARRPSNWFRLSKRNLAEPEEVPRDNRVLQMKQPLMKNGRQTGWISISLDAKWMVDGQVIGEKNRRGSANKHTNGRRSTAAKRRGTGGHSPQVTDPFHTPDRRRPSLGESSRQSREAAASRYSPYPSPRPSPRNSLTKNMLEAASWNTPTRNSREVAVRNSPYPSPRPSPRPSLTR